MAAVPVLRRRADFLAAARARRQSRIALNIQARERAPDEPAGDGPRVGFTCSKKVGNAVARNRAKRRLREAARALTPIHGRPGCDYVFIARSGTAERAWDRLLDDVKSALTRLATPRAASHVESSSLTAPRREDPARPDTGQDR